VSTIVEQKNVRVIKNIMQKNVWNKTMNAQPSSVQAGHATAELKKRHARAAARARSDALVEREKRRTGSPEREATRKHRT
jgi:hypothetical protein